MATDRTGYVYMDKMGRWYARITITDSCGKRRNVKRRAVDKADAKETLKKLLQQIEEEGSRFADTSRITFNDLADFYESRYLQPAEYRDGRKISGLRDVSRPLGCLRSFRDFFGRKKLREMGVLDFRRVGVTAGLRVASRQLAAARKCSPSSQARCPTTSPVIRSTDPLPRRCSGRAWRRHEVPEGD